MVRTTAAQAEQPKRAFLKPRWLVLLGCALLIVVLSVSLRPLVRWQTRQQLDRIEGASADFSGAQLTLIPLRYRITHLKVREQKPKTKEPVFYADEVAVRLSWGPLLTGRLAGSVEGQKAKVVLHQPESGESRLPPIEKVVPFRALLERGEVNLGEVLYVWVHKEGQPSIWFHGIHATLQNVGSRPDLARPMVLSARGKVQRSGTMTVSIKADPYATPLSFSGKATLTGFDPSEMNGLIADEKGVKLTPGRFDMEMVFECRRGRLLGWIDPRLLGTEITAADNDLASALKSMLGKMSMTFESPTEGTEPSGRIAIEEDLRNPKLQLWPTMEKVIEHGFLIGLEEGLRRNVAPGKGVDRPPKKPGRLKVQG